MQIERSRTNPSTVQSRRPDHFLLRGPITAIPSSPITGKPVAYTAARPRCGCARPAVATAVLNVTGIVAGSAVEIVAGCVEFLSRTHLGKLSGTDAGGADPSNCTVQVKLITCEFPIPLTAT